jgi:hypothetical protein
MAMNVEGNVMSRQIIVYRIYFILCRTTNRVKIGSTARDPNERLEELRAMNAGELTPLGIIEGELRLETDLHIRFESYWVHHEWFEYSPEIDDYVQTKAEPWPFEFVPKLGEGNQDPMVMAWSLHKDGKSLGEIAKKMKIPAKDIKKYIRMAGDLIQLGDSMCAESGFNGTQAKNEDGSDRNSSNCPICGALIAGTDALSHARAWKAHRCPSSTLTQKRRGRPKVSL